MKTTIKEQDGNLVAVLEGRLDTAASSAAEKEMQPLIDCMGHNIVIDCTDLEYIASSGLRIFLNILKNAKSKGSKVFIDNINSEIRKVFMMTGFFNLFEIRDTRGAQ